jgi:hypothetical protein
VREHAGRVCEICRVGELNPMRGSSRESRLWTRVEEETPGEPGAPRVLRLGRARRTQYDRYFTACEYSGGAGNFMTAQADR